MFVIDEEEKKKKKEKEKQEKLDEIIKEREAKLKKEEEKEKLKKEKLKKYKYCSSSKKKNWFGRLWRCMVPAGAIIGVGCSLWLGNQFVIWGASIIEATKGKVNLEGSVVGIIKTGTFWKFVGFAAALGFIAFCCWSIGASVNDKLEASKKKKKASLLKKQRGKNKKKKREYGSEHYGKQGEKNIYNSPAKISKRDRNFAMDYYDNESDFSTKNNMVSYSNSTKPTRSRRR